MRPEWKEYWNNPQSPHPDLQRPQKPVQATQRAFPKGVGHCHHYRMVNEHYHGTMAELEACEK